MAQEQQQQYGEREEEYGAEEVAVDVDGFVVQMEPGAQAGREGRSCAAVAGLDVGAALLLPFFYIGMILDMGDEKFVRLLALGLLTYFCPEK